MSFVFRKHVSLAETEFGAVLLDQRSGRYWEMNPTAALIVRALEAGETPERTAEIVAGKFAVDRDRSLADVSNIIGKIAAAGLLS
ncbi:MULTISPECIES: lasso peptide biosynthesis PqqD family chaperone [unclassified Amycolatopsis]|uniref:lasso peptide biosynthesis PqqD family chaperone n=1 Tax=unclassified Amycolatopsis TaxID=2618356 RepID=UPI00106ED983|nr:MULTISPECIES: lasso peptide biosynthesis PqqD family chaperone [unclassified Amycolatopsis]MCG3754328.1 lasso peptide biosynthesis PqqD family chaperone [Amycolatopsis sp. Poz14]